MSAALILTLEELALNAWPALTLLHDDGWVLRFSRGYTRRANSIMPIYASSRALDAKIDRCETLYKRCGLPVSYRLTPASQPDGIDAALDRRGYGRDGETLVQVLDLAAASISAADRGSFQVTPQPDTAWLDAFIGFRADDPARRPTIEALLNHIVLAAGYAALEIEGQLAGVGMAVLDGEWGFVQAVAVDPARRGQGWGREVMVRLLDWCRMHGARRICLQVMARNTVALNLYASLGFSEVYRYWYRLAPA